ncbi:MAG TPA: methyltransferase domain-containing protein [Thermoleophilaceae bacterium]|nr:methyltransferase domain-containing protein [Thermoleophilaceae bacterium]
MGGILAAMLDDVLALLCCPHCGLSLEAGGGSVRCPNGHSFDVARQGYLSLLPGDAQLGSADTAPMVAARERFLGAGHFDPLADALAETAERELETGPEGSILDLGAGTGWYLSRLLERLPGRTGLALDLSKHALRRAALAHERIGAVAADAWQSLPVRDGAAALAISVFAPRNGPELARVLKPGGALIVALPTEHHLAELVEALGLLSVDQYKRERLAAKLDPHFGVAHESPLEWTLELDRAAVRDAVTMGPSSAHTDPAALALPEPVAVRASVEISVRRR